GSPSTSTRWTSGSSSSEPGARGNIVSGMLVNRRASHEFELLDRFTAGIELTGSEVKSLRQGGGSIAEAYALVRNAEVFVEGMIMPPYKVVSYKNLTPARPRRPLLMRREIEELERAVSRQGLTIVPLRLHFQDGWAKLDLAV